MVESLLYPKSPSALKADSYQLSGSLGVQGLGVKQSAHSPDVRHLRPSLSVSLPNLRGLGSVAVIGRRLLVGLRSIQHVKLLENSWHLRVVLAMKMKCPVWKTYIIQGESSVLKQEQMQNNLICAQHLSVN